jgi:3-methyl-2-oxobutanoate hydroxymethyltransferase
MSTGSSGRRTTIRRLLEMKERGEKIVALTAYDYLFARLVDESGVDVVLVGDSLGQVVLGHETTLPVTLEDMIHHARAVRRGVRHALLVVDMPFLTFNVAPEETVRNAGRLLAETGAEAVKLEGGSELTCEHVERLVGAGIPVMGHVGSHPSRCTPWAATGSRAGTTAPPTGSGGGPKALAEAGCFSIVLELVPADLAAEITAASRVPTIGIGAGPQCDGQILVLPDMLGLNEGFQPRFLRRFAELARRDAPGRGGVCGGGPGRRSTRGPSTHE